MPLDLAAGGLRDALDGDDRRDFQACLLVDQAGDLSCRRQKILHIATVEHEHHELLDLGVARTHAGGYDLAELEAFRSLRNRLDVMRVIVLAVDEDNFLRTT